MSDGLPPSVLDRAPAYLLDVGRLEERYGEFDGAFRRRFPSAIVAYSYKTNYLPFLCRRLHRLGASAEVVSELEYRLARRLGVPASRIVFNGPARTEGALGLALREGAFVNLDSLEEVAVTERLLRSMPEPESARIGLRVALEIPDDQGVRRESRFGLSIEGGELEPAAERLLAAGSRHVGLHVHASTKERSALWFAEVADRLGRAARRLGVERLAFLDVGGGFGFAPPESTWLSFPSFNEYAAVVHDHLLAAIPGASGLVLITEPGIALVGDCLSLVAPVRSIKRRSHGTLVTIDASVHTVRPTRHRRALAVTALDAQGLSLDGPPSCYSLVGYTCMEEDIVAEAVMLPELKVGDYVRIDNLGGYTWVFKPRFIRQAPPILALEKGSWREVHPEESFGDFVYGLED